MVENIYMDARVIPFFAKISIRPTARIQCVSFIVSSFSYRGLFQMESQTFSMLFSTFYFHVFDSLHATWHGEKPIRRQA